MEASFILGPYKHFSPNFMSLLAITLLWWEKKKPEGEIQNECQSSPLALPTF